MKIIDTHIHIWDLDKFFLPWLNGTENVLNRSYTINNYEEDIEKDSKYNIEKAIYIEVDADYSQKHMENIFIIEQYENLKSIIAGGVISGNMEDEKFNLYIDKYKHPAIKGVRHVLHVDSSPKGMCLKPSFIRNVQELGRRGLVFEACVRNPELDDLYKMALQCPETTIILDHMGNVDVDIIAKKNFTKEEEIYKKAWIENIIKLASLENVVCKISGLNPVGQWDIYTLKSAIDFVLDTFNDERVIFGSNYPVCNISTKLIPWIEALDQITMDRGEIFRNKFFYKNAQRIYKL
ncbi:amidohydrolase family protein [Clostridium sp. Marseille-Q2269]|uniref:amidohydrolase family protein n=1 Tax=Clostridium sp. Marseille-Q2269 TaxID=2942205 RepID=UPI002073604C|nr:amidohydrolase family protein [Clostridium sp. Marseille-Q2269]